MRERRPVLLVFTLGAAGDRERRPLLPGRLRPLQEAEIDLRRACLGAALAAGREAGCRLAVSSPATHFEPSAAAAASGKPVSIAEPSSPGGPREDVLDLPQRGSGFGARLANAVAAAFAAAGGGPVVAVGTDSPGLGAVHLRAALDRLDGHPDRVVAGPCPDGGFYLLAAARPIPGLAAGVSWCSGHTLASLRRLLAAGGRELVELEPLADLDRPADLERWLAGAAGGLGLAAADADLRRLARLLARLLALLKRPAVPPRLGRPRIAATPLPSGRGPPAPDARLLAAR